MNPFMKEARADEYAARALWASLHTDDPGDVGDNEFAAPRVAIVWAAGAEPGDRESDPMDFAVPDDTQLLYVGIWDDDTAGNFLDSRVNYAYFAEAGTYTITLLHTEA